MNPYDNSLEQAQELYSRDPPEEKDLKKARYICCFQQDVLMKLSISSMNAIFIPPSSTIAFLNGHRNYSSKEIPKKETGKTHFRRFKLDIFISMIMLPMNALFTAVQDILVNMAFMGSIINLIKTDTLKRHKCIQMNEKIKTGDHISIDKAILSGNKKIIQRKIFGSPSIQETKWPSSFKKLG